MIDVIEISIRNGVLSQIEAIIIYKDKICYYNNKKIIVDDNFLDRLKRIIFPWKNEYGKSNDIDSEEFDVDIICGNKREKYHGCGIFPNNYYEFKELLGELDGR